MLLRINVTKLKLFTDRTNNQDIVKVAITEVNLTQQKIEFF